MRHSQSMPSSSFVDPSSLSLPSPPSEASSPQSPAIDPSLEPATSSSSSGPPRKRARTDASPEEKREARAHRNRIAAQHSRDRRKLQFVELENKVTALQQENEQLRNELQEEKARRDGAKKDRENAELKERVKSLEQGWEAVLKALQTQGLPSSLFANQAKADNASSSPAPSTDGSPSAHPPTTAFPVLVHTSPLALPLSPLSTSSSGVLSPSITGGDRRSHSGVPAAGGPVFDIDLGLLSSTDSPAGSQDNIETPKDEDTHIEDWFREVLASHDSPAACDNLSGPTAASPGSSTLGARQEQKAPATEDVITFDFTPGSGEDVEMDRLLDLLPANGNELQVILGSVMEGGTPSGTTAEEDWSWEFAQPSVAVV